VRAPALLVVLSVTACRRPGSGPPLPSGYVAEGATVRPGSVSTTPQTLHDLAAGALRLPPLARAALPTGERELRVSTGHGMALGAEYPLLRVRAGPWGVAGEVLFYRAVPPRRARAVGPGAAWNWAARRAALSPPPDWRALLARLDDLRIATPVTPPSEARGVVDAGELVVEARDGAAYVAYDVNAPRFRTDAEGRRAAAVARIVDSLAAATRALHTHR
jgi:hypothetical protein